VKVSIEKEISKDDRDRVRWITLSRSESRNGLTLPLVERLTMLLAEAAEDAEVRVVVLTGVGGSFCSGLDLKYALMNPTSDFEAGIDAFHALVRALRKVLKPTIAAVDGAADGLGCDLALGCDLRLATPAARFGERFVRIGLMPDGGGTFLLRRLIGPARALELIYEGRMVEAEEAAAMGLVNRLLPSEGFAEAVQQHAARLATGAPLAFARSKAAILRATQAEFDEALAAEREGQLALLASADFMEGVQAFLTKREPVFGGR
jgi:enoyl-CoA hydratase/carnithine racemase